MVELADRHASFQDDFYHKLESLNEISVSMAKSFESLQDIIEDSVVDAMASARDRLMASVGESRRLMYMVGNVLRTLEVQFYTLGVCANMFPRVRGKKTVGGEGG